MFTQPASPSATGGPSLRTPAALYFLSRAGFVTAVGAGVAGWVSGLLPHDQWPAAAAAGAGVLILFAWSVRLAGRPRCPVCREAVLRATGPLHPYARKWLGLSPVAPVAWEVLTSDSHQCMHCHSRCRNRRADRGKERPLPGAAAVPWDQRIGGSVFDIARPAAPAAFASAAAPGEPSPSFGAHTPPPAVSPLPRHTPPPERGESPPSRPPTGPVWTKPAFWEEAAGPPPPAAAPQGLNPFLAQTREGAKAPGGPSSFAPSQAPSPFLAQPAEPLKPPVSPLPSSDPNPFMIKPAEPDVSAAAPSYTAPSSPPPTAPLVKPVDLQKDTERPVDFAPPAWALPTPASAAPAGYPFPTAPTPPEAAAPAMGDFPPLRPASPAPATPAPLSAKHDAQPSTPMDSALPSPLGAFPPPPSHTRPIPVVQPAPSPSAAPVQSATARVAEPSPDVLRSLLEVMREGRQALDTAFDQILTRLQHALQEPPKSSEPPAPVQAPAPTSPPLVAAVPPASAPAVQVTSVWAAAPSPPEEVVPPAGSFPDTFPVFDGKTAPFPTPPPVSERPAAASFPVEPPVAKPIFPPPIQTLPTPVPITPPASPVFPPPPAVVAPPPIISQVAEAPKAPFPPPPAFFSSPEPAAPNPPASVPSPVFPAPPSPAEERSPSGYFPSSSPPPAGAAPVRARRMPSLDPRTAEELSHTLANAFTPRPPAPPPAAPSAESPFQFLGSTINEEPWPDLPDSPWDSKGRSRQT